LTISNLFSNLRSKAKHVKDLLIAVDGYSSCGKSTFAKAIAKQLGYTYIDSGAMYRAVTLYAINNKVLSNGIIQEQQLYDLLQSVNIQFINNSKLNVNQTWLNGKNVEQEIRSFEIAENVSLISKLKFVRDKMVELQRMMGQNKAVVMDGRDIGTVVFPHADIKLFMIADPDIRALRRYKEQLAKGEHASLEEIKRNLLKRDHIDETRAESPLKKAEDAIVLDNSYMTPDKQLQWFMNEILPARLT
jgi:CMP/dCMP kinase